MVQLSGEGKLWTAKRCISALAWPFPSHAVQCTRGLWMPFVPVHGDMFPYRATLSFVLWLQCAVTQIVAPPLQKYQHTSGRGQPRLTDSCQLHQLCRFSNLSCLIAHHPSHLWDSSLKRLSATSPRLCCKAGDNVHRALSSYIPYSPVKPCMGMKFSQFDHRWIPRQPLLWEKYKLGVWIHRNATSNF